MKKRDLNIVKNYKREISLQTKVVRDRTKYTRKQKHKKSIFIIKWHFKSLCECN